MKTAPRSSSKKAPQGVGTRWRAPSKAEIHRAVADETAAGIEAVFKPEIDAALDFSKPAEIIRNFVMGFTSGDVEALEKMVSLASWYVTLLNAVLRTEPSLAVQIASRRSLWPMMTSHASKVIADNSSFLESLQLGSQVDHSSHVEKIGIIRNDAKRFAVALIRLIEHLQMAASFAETVTSNTKHYRMAFDGSLALLSANDILRSPQYTDHIVAACVALPPLRNDPLVLNAWWRVGKDLLMLNTSGKPEGVPELREIGKYNAKHVSSLKKVEFTRNQEDDEPVLLEGSSNANIRAAIFKRLKKEFCSIAGHAPTKSR